MPADCTATQTTYNDMFMTCTNRPRLQRWHPQAAYAYFPCFVVDP